MRWLWVLVIGGLVWGCASRNAPPGTSGAPGASAKQSGVIVTPGGTLPGKVVRLNTSARFAVVRFPLGTLPAPETRLNVYRNGLKVGELKVSREQRDTLVVADIMAGDCQMDDEVRAE